MTHALFDDLLCGLDPLAQLLYFHLNRYRDGGSNFTVVVSWPRLMRRIPVSESTLRRAYAALNRAGLAFVHKAVYGKGSAQGNIFRVVTGDSPSTHESPSVGGTHKRKEEEKENQKGASVCDLCKEQNGFVYVDPDNLSLGVRKCTHGAGK